MQRPSGRRLIQRISATGYAISQLAVDRWQRHQDAAPMNRTYVRTRFLRSSIIYLPLLMHLTHTSLRELELPDRFSLFNVDSQSGSAQASLTCFDCVYLCPTRPALATWDFVYRPSATDSYHSSHREQCTLLHPRP